MGDLKPASQVAPVFDPGTGELVPLGSPTDRLAEALFNIRDFEGELRTTKMRVAEEIHRRMDPEGLWTVRVGGWEVKGEAPGKVDYDGERLSGELAALVAEGLITPRAAAEACEPVTTYKPRLRGINALRKLAAAHPEIGEALDRCVVEVERPRRVSVKPVQEVAA